MVQRNQGQSSGRIICISGGKGLVIIWVLSVLICMAVPGDSSAIALRKMRTPEEIKRATMHSTNKAFERYFRIEGDDLRSIYEDASRGVGGSKNRVVNRRFRD
jgi:hypothetical protein